MGWELWLALITVHECVCGVCGRRGRCYLKQGICPRGSISLCPATVLSSLFPLLVLDCDYLWGSVKFKVTQVGGQMFATHRSSLTELRVSHGGRRLSRQQSFPSEPLQVPKVGSSGRRSSSSSGQLLSLSFSGSMRSEFDRYLSEQSLCPLRQQRSNHADLKGLREVRAAAQLKNLEDFLRSNEVSLQDCVAYHTGMKYR